MISRGFIVSLFSLFNPNDAHLESTVLVKTELLSFVNMAASFEIYLSIFKLVFHAKEAFTDNYFRIFLTGFPVKCKHRLYGELEVQGLLIPNTIRHINKRKPEYLSREKELTVGKILYLA